MLYWIETLLLSFSYVKHLTRARIKYAFCVNTFSNGFENPLVIYESFWKYQQERLLCCSFFVAQWEKASDGRLLFSLWLFLNGFHTHCFQWWWSVFLDDCERVCVNSLRFLEFPSPSSNWTTIRFNKQLNVERGKWNKTKYLISIINLFIIYNAYWM